VDEFGNRVVDTDATIRQYSPTGGNTLVIGNVEWRIRPPFLSDALQFATFVDAGVVWDRGRPDVPSVRFDDIRVTPGVGLRVNSPVGPFRVDLAYNRYPLSEGSVYYLGSDNTLRCVSRPRNPGVGGGVGPIVSTSCPQTFTPVQSGSFFNRLTFNFSIGQAF
jgi:hypothetical protein